MPLLIDLSQLLAYIYPTTVFAGVICRHPFDITQYSELQDITTQRL